MDISLHARYKNSYVGAAILTEEIVYEKWHFFVRPAIGSVDHSVPLFFSQHDVSLELATLLPRKMIITDICNKTYSNLLCVPTGCSSCKNSPAVLWNSFIVA
jgi:hypothetical protein